MDKLFNRLVKPLQVAAGIDDAGKPIIGGQGANAERQAKLDSELPLDPAVIAARKLLDAGKISVEEFNKRANTHR